jgi:hypothetical protein
MAPADLLLPVRRTLSTATPGCFAEADQHASKDGCSTGRPVG